ncbi:MAG TPA: DNA polymerase III subunit gamma/tau [Chloroflexia bacterium]|nr:DNA polymerase III subunit gamma/tau [Chloroflexia bacterium]
MSADAPVALSLFAPEPEPAPAGPAAPPAPSGAAKEAPAAAQAPTVSNGALYRRYRSRDFHELVGQEPIVHTLQNALQSGRLAHAYLFCGPRGTGKTSTARLLAKAVNCQAPEGVERPCNACDACRAINEGRAVDLIEIDAASNNSVEDVRDLRERVNFAPAQMRRKFYIIDEVHMMSTSAFNALLKTLEEPPAHTIFVLATTDPQKLPATVLSRCQRFDFRRIALPIMVQHMTGIVASEGYAVEPGVLELIGRQATGCMRDALSLLDQLMSFTDGTLTLAQVESVLGARSAAEVAAFVEQVIAGDVAGGLHALHTAIENGADPRQFNRQVVEYLRGLLLLRAGGDAAALEATEEEIALLRAQAGRVGLPALTAWIRAFSNADTGLKNGMYGALPLELALVEASLADTAPAPQAGAPAPQPAAPAPRPHTPPARSQGIAEPRPAPAAASPAPPRERPVPPPAPLRAAPPPIAAEDAAPPAAAVTGSGDIAAVLDNWARVVEAVRARSPRVQALLRAPAVPIALDANFVVLGFGPKSEFHRKKLEEPPNRDAVEQALAEVLGHAYHVRCVAVSDDELARAQAARRPSPDGAEAPLNPRALKAKAIFEEDEE